MSLKEHPDYLEEKQRLKDTIKYVETAIAATEISRKQLKEDTLAAYKELDPSDSNQSYVRIITNARFLDSLERNYSGLIRAKKKPYFCRIDFRQDGSSELEKLYIGKTSLSRVEDNSQLIVDWRAPIASIYYDGRLGHVTYSSPSGTLGGELLLKRQYTINEGNLDNIMDIDITTNDTLLQAALGENKDNRLKDIVSTIQAEQNEIIRADISNPLIIQGAAGSGKTTIALHRIAYLVYTYEKDFDPDNFLIIAPNRLFLNYISEVLPELGVEQVKQTTFIELAYELLGKKYKLTNSDEKLIKFINSSTKGKLDSNTSKDGNSAVCKDRDLSLLHEISQFKSSLEFRDIVNNYIYFLEESFIPKQDFSLLGYPIFKSEEIKKMFLTDFSYLPMYKRLQEIRKVLNNKLKRDKEYIIKKIEEHYDRKIDMLIGSIGNPEKRREKTVALINMRDRKVEAVTKAAKTAVSDYLSLISKKDIMEYYKELVVNIENLKIFSHGSVDHGFLSCFSEYNRKLLNSKTIEYEDLAALIYMKYKIHGFNKKVNVRYVVIDEAQDFSLFQVYALKEVLNTELFTILGDLAQGIHSYRSIRDWKDIQEKVFTSGKCKYLTLEQSYRTTIEIMNVANEVLKISKIPDLVLAKPVVRHGRKPGICKYDTKDKLIDALEKRIMDLKEDNYTSVAVICKTFEECRMIKKLLTKRAKVTVKQLNPDDITYEGGIVIIPSYLAKGLEFDAVIICTIETDYLLNELDIKLLYVSMTRALHSLDIMSTGNTMDILKQIPEDLYTKDLS